MGHGDGVLGRSGGSRWSAGIFQHQGCIWATVGRTDERTDGRTDGRMDGQTNGRMDGKSDRVTS